jgi:sterol desaturase/sphingolipid hydroxylase (fatty acid hydroxylase superfamily)
MIFFHRLFQPRQLPDWWVRFTDNHPIIPNLIAVAGLFWITFALAHSTNKVVNQERERGAAVQNVQTMPEPGASTDPAGHLKAVYRNWFPQEVRSIVGQLFRNPALYLLVPFLLLLELLFPCNSSQPLIGKGFLQDAVWFVAFAPVRVLILFPIGEVLEAFFKAHREFLNIGALATWPVWGRFVAAVLLGELLIWLNHFVRHKVRVLWLFHSVHHSQKELNLFTDDRDHVVDAILESLFAFVPFFLFQLPNIYAVTVIGLYLPIHNRFIHSNLRMNLGWLGWLITSPQFHRVHHSAELEHVDKNFGVHLALFDHLFGTACRSTSVYPQTGIADSQFPFEADLRWSQLPKNWFKQTIYPFRQLFEEQRVRVRSFVENRRSLRRGVPERRMPN